MLVSAPLGVVLCDRLLHFISERRAARALARLRQRLRVVGLQSKLQPQHFNNCLKNSQKTYLVKYSELDSSDFLNKNNNKNIKVCCWWRHHAHSNKAFFQWRKATQWNFFILTQFWVRFIVSFRMFSKFWAYFMFETQHISFWIICNSILCPILFKNYRN